MLNSKSKVIVGSACIVALVSFAASANASTPLQMPSQNSGLTGISKTTTVINQRRYQRVAGLLTHKHVHCHRDRYGNLVKHSHTHLKMSGHHIRHSTGKVYCPGYDIKGKKRR